MFYGYIGKQAFWQYLVITLVLTHITIAAVTIFLHRGQAHRALTLHPIISHFFRFWLWLTTGMETKAWTAIHRKHHAKCETSEDPHSPQVMGIKTVLSHGAELYRRESKNQMTLDRYGQGTPDDWLENNLYAKHSALGIKLALLIDLLVFGVPGIVIWTIQMGWIPFFAAGVINGLGHYWGYRNTECSDAATNLSPWGILIGGEELHNNHHSFPTSAKLSMKWWEFDIGWMYIKLLSYVGLAKPKRVLPKTIVDLNKKVVDEETIAALIPSRFQIMTSYTKKVMLPAWMQEKVNTQDHQLWYKIKDTLSKSQFLVDAASKAKLEATLQEYHLTQQLYLLREKLHEIWDKTTATQKELIESFQDWCSVAEASGVKALQEFAAYLKGFKLEYHQV